MKHLIKDLEWDWSYGDGGKTNAVCRAKSPSHEYIIRLEAGGDFYVDYRKFDSDEDSDNRKDEPPVFDSMKAAQNWVQLIHYPSKMTKWLNPDPLTDTVNWFKEAKPEPQGRDACVQVGCHFEEFGEMLESLEFKNIGITTWVKNIAGLFKAGQYADEINSLSDEDRINLLDALADQIVTAVGVAYMMGFDIIGALSEVNASNWSKFENGKAVTDENGKIIKGSDYFKPQLEKYLGGSND